MKFKTISIVKIAIPIIFLVAIIMIDFEKIFCQKDFGPELNKQRITFHIPIIPNFWHLKESYDHAAYWIDKYGIIGHEGKTVVFYNREIKQEEDLYILKRQSGAFRSILIISKYLRDRSGNNRKFSYRFGDSTFSISSKKADSLLNAERIRKDY